MLYDLGIININMHIKLIDYKIGATFEKLVD